MSSPTMKADYSDWQRLAPLALVFLFIQHLQKFIRENIYLFVGAGAGFAFIDWMGTRELLLGAVGVLLAIIGGTFIYFRRFRFRIDEDAVRVRRGVIEKKELRVRFDRIQNIQIGQPFYFRPFGLVRFSLETPGASDKEIELPGIPRELAECMRERVATHQNDSAVDAVPARESGAGPADTVYRAGPMRLFVHGLASNQVWVLVGGLGYLFSQFHRRITAWFEDLAFIEAVMNRVDDGWLVTVALLVTLLSVLFALSGLIAVVRFHGFRLDQIGDRLVARHGLVERREQTVRRNKVTGLVFRQSAVGRLIGCWQLVVRQTRSGDQEDLGARSGFMVPGMTRADLELAEAVIPDAGVPDRLTAVSPHFRRVFWTRWFALGVCALLVFAVVWSWGHWSTLMVAALTAWMLLVLHLRYRHWGWQRQGDLLWVRQGLLGQRIDGFPLSLVQQARVIQSLYQRRHELATVQLTLPQGNVTIPFLPLEMAADIANQALFEAETAPTHRV